MSGADVAAYVATERSRVPFLSVRIVVASLAIVVSTVLLWVTGLPALPPNGFGLLHFLADLIACSLQLAFQGTTTAYNGTPSLARSSRP